MSTRHNLAELGQLAVDFRGDFPTEGTWYEEKFDGFRAFYFRGTDGQPRLFSRNGRPIEGVGHILSRLGMMEEAAGQPLFIDGEFQVSGTLEATKHWVERGHKLDRVAGVFRAFDMLPLWQWKAGGTEQRQIDRKVELLALFKATRAVPGDDWTWAEGSKGQPDPTRGAVEIVPDGWAIDGMHLLSEVRRVWTRGGEGVMLKDADAPYWRGRNDHWRKLKRENAGKWIARL